MKSKLKNYDIIVVGTGATGSWVARKFALAGKKVLVLDAGELRHSFLPNPHETFEHSKAQEPIGYNLRPVPSSEHSRQAIQSLHYAWPFDPGAFVDDLDNPYTNRDNSNFQWIRSRQVGGRMLIPKHGRRMTRLSEEEFSSFGNLEHDSRWPFEFRELERNYESVEKSLRYYFPNSKKKLGPWAGVLQKGFQGAKIEEVAIAVPPLGIFEALGLENVELRTNSIVSHIITDGGGATAIGAAYVNSKTLHGEEVFAKQIILCASCLESTRILLNTETKQSSPGIGSKSGVLGHYLMDHIAVQAEAVLSVDSETCVESARYYISPFYFESPKRKSAFGIQVAVEPIGKDAIHFSFLALGEMQARLENCVTLNRKSSDRWGIPTLDIHCSHSEFDLAIAREQLEILSKIGNFVDGLKIMPEHRLGLPRPPGRSNHECGTARMGINPKTSVLNPKNETWNLKDLFVLDASCFVNQGYRGPTLTMLALANRAVDSILRS